MKDFHAHLETCEQCRTQPFNLCPEGEQLLLTAADQALVQLARELRGSDAHLGAVERDHDDDSVIGYGHGH